MNEILPEKKACCCSQSKERDATITKTSCVKKTTKTAGSIVLSVLIAFFPKCPMCWAAYMSVFGGYSLSQLPFMSWMLPVLMLFLALHLFLIIRKIKQKGYGPIVLSLIGALLILLEKTIWPYDLTLLYSGLILILAGSLWNNFTLTRVQRAQ